jgi:guanylate kinase
LNKPAPTQIARRGLMLVLSSPSGAGKTTISRELLAQEPDIMLSVSCTTRPKRPGEVSGRDYHFIALDDFDLMRNRQEFLEYAKVFGHYYGTPREPVETALAEGRDVLFDIDWQGTQQLRQSARSDLVSVFILPPTAGELARRLHRRASDPEDVVATRMAKASQEISHWAEYDYIVVNDEVTNSVGQVRAILHAERLRRERQIGLTEFVKRLDGEL